MLGVSNETIDNNYELLKLLDAHSKNKDFLVATKLLEILVPLTANVNLDLAMIELKMRQENQNQS